MRDPVFAVIGHPNKGKSSLVASLAQDDSVDIGPEPGTTREARRYPMRLDGELLYTLIDTPGFQRPRATLEWLEAHAASAADRPGAVARFVAAHHDNGDFAAECALLAPVVAGAAILYVVDGAVPYGVEFEPQMEILRWTGRPSMAVINPIGAPAHVAEWRDALGQYFRLVRVLDARDAPFVQRLALLRAFGELDPDWRPALTRAIQALAADRVRRRQRAARRVAEMIATAVGFELEEPIPSHGAPAAAGAALEARYLEALRALEDRCREQVESLYDHRGLDRREASLAGLDADLFSAEVWRLFGLPPRELRVAITAGGAAAGVGVDALLGGLSLGAGTLVGAALGGALGWAGAGQLPGNFSMRRRFGQRTLRCGPAGTTGNLPWVLIGRARVHHASIATRTHARRDALVLDEAAGGAPRNPLEPETRNALARALFRLRLGLPGGDRLESLATTLDTLLAADLGEDRVDDPPT